MNKSLKQISNLHSYLLSLHSPQTLPSNATRSVEGVNFGASCQAMDRMDVIPKMTAAGTNVLQAQQTLGLHRFHGDLMGIWYPISSRHWKLQSASDCHTPCNLPVPRQSWYIALGLACHLMSSVSMFYGKTLTVLPWNSMHLLWQRKSVCFTTGSPPRYSRFYRFFFCFSAGIRWEKCAPCWACHAVRMYCIYWYILITYNIQSIPSVCSRYT